MVIRWQLQFRDINDALHVVDIYDASASTATVKQLTGAADPFTTDEQSDDDLYVPIRTQSGYIRIVIQDGDESLVADLMPETSTSRPVVLHDADGNVEWLGFLTGEQYSQPWAPAPYEVELPVQGIMSAMEGVKFQQDEGFTDVRSLFETISGCLPSGVLDFAFSDVMDATLSVVNSNFQDYMSRQEREDSGTEDVYDTISIAEAMEYFCKYFGVSCRQQGGQLVFFAHDASTYAHSSGHWSDTPASHELSSLTIKAKNNTVNYSQPYGVVIGEFDVGSAKSDESVFEMPSDFADTFGIYSIGHWRVIYYDNDQYQCYVDGVRGVDFDFEYGTSKNTSYGGLISLPGGSVSSDGLNRDWTSGLVFRSTKNAEQCKAMVVTSTRKFYFPMDDTSLISINADVTPLMGGTFGNGTVRNSSQYDIKAIYAKIRIGKYWLKYTTAETTNAAGITSTTHSVEWVTEECVSRFPLDDGNIEFWTDVTTELPYYSPNRLMEGYSKLSGVCVNIPSDLKGTSADLYVEFVANAYSSDEYTYESKNYLQYLLTNFSVGIYFAADTTAQLSSDNDQNRYVVDLDNAYTSKYEVSSTITTRRGMQHGTGLALDANRSYVSEQYDLEGLQRRAKLLGKCREILTIYVDGVLPSYDVVSYNSKSYAIISQSVDWRNATTKLRILNID